MNEHVQEYKRYAKLITGHEDFLLINLYRTFRPDIVKRTEQQNKAIHVFCRELAKALNDAGHGMKDVMLGGQLQLFYDLHQEVIKLLHADEILYNDFSVDLRKLRQTMSAIKIERLIKEIPCTEENIKEDVWKPIQKAMFNKSSTTMMERLEVSEVYETVNRFTAERFGVSVPFPSEETMSEEQR